MTALVRAAALTNFSEVAQELGFDPSAALRRAGLRAELIRQPDQLIEADRVARLFEDAAREHGCESFGLRIAARRQLSNFGVVSLLLMHQPTLRQVLLTLIEHLHLLNERLAIGVEDVGNLVVLREELVLPVAARQSIELAIGVLYRHGRGAASGALATDQRELHARTARRPGLSSPLLQVPRRLRCRLQRAGVPGDRSGCGQSGGRSGAGRIRQEDDRGAARRSAALDRPGGSQGHLPDAADGPRHLQIRRRPAWGSACERCSASSTDAHSPSRRLINEVRQELRAPLCRHTHHSLGEVAAMLGYTTHSAFTRWFGPQFGCSPETWRTRSSTAASRTIRRSPRAAP